MIDFNFHLSIGTFLASAAVVTPFFVGVHLFRTGAADCLEGCKEMRNEANWICRRLQLLKDVLPVLCVFRAFCAPSMWYILGENRDWGGAFVNVPTILWATNFVISWALLAEVLLMSGVRHVLNSHHTMQMWPEECALQRPYHGKASTRCHALNGGFWQELLWNIWIIYWGKDYNHVIGGITIPAVIFFSGMIAGGPVNFMVRKPTVDVWVAQTFVLTTIFAVEGYVLLNHSWFGLAAALDPLKNSSAFGPYGHWSVHVYNAILMAQAFTCRWAVVHAKELNMKPPWSAGGADHKEFFFPRFWGLIHVTYGLILCFNMWIVGIWLIREDHLAIFID